MAATSPIPTPDEQPRLLTPLGIVKIATVLLMVGVSAWLLWTHTEWFENPSLVKVEVLSWGIWGPVIYMLLYAVGPSFLVPGAVMTIAGGLYVSQSPMPPTAPPASNRPSGLMSDQIYPLGPWTALAVKVRYSSPAAIS